MNKTNNKRRRVALFGGSFNPPHIGHSAICKWIMDRNIADEVWIIPCFIHPFGKKLVPFEHRLEMCKQAFSKLKLPLSVLEVERGLGNESKTVRTVEHLIEQNPGVEFSLITGGDIDSEFEDWHNFERIKQLVDIIRVPRGKGSPIPNVSSTDIRARIRSGLPHKDMVDKDVAVYIIAKSLYRDDEVTA